MAAGFGTAEGGSTELTALEQVVQRLEDRVRATEAADAINAQAVIKMAEGLAKERIADLKDAVRMAEVLARERLVDVKEWRSDVQEFVKELATLKTDVANIRANSEAADVETKEEIRWVRRLLLSVLVTAVLSGVVSSLLVAFGGAHA